MVPDLRPQEAERLLGKAKEENARLQKKLCNLEELNLLATKKAPHKKSEDECQQDLPMTGYGEPTKARTRKNQRLPSRLVA
ncbi:hypothetical protein CLOM_g1882 [Closterium sp. NIES-68]|nr:hypothetical protein CLOM_g1882 [Closterium sp. NIES-68]GJP77192.1 hypothetical protein CLOP_g7621 [Closterium sp. NIES-67]